VPESAEVIWGVRDYRSSAASLVIRDEIAGEQITDPIGVARVEGGRPCRKHPTDAIRLIVRGVAGEPIGNAPTSSIPASSGRHSIPVPFDRTPPGPLIRSRGAIARPGNPGPAKATAALVIVIGEPGSPRMAFVPRFDGAPRRAVRQPEGPPEVRIRAA